MYVCINESVCLSLMYTVVIQVWSAAQKCILIYIDNGNVLALGISSRKTFIIATEWHIYTRDYVSLMHCPETIRGYPQFNYIFTITAGKYVYA